MIVSNCILNLFKSIFSSINYLEFKILIIINNLSKKDDETKQNQVSNFICDFIVKCMCIGTAFLKSRNTFKYDLKGSQTN